MKLRLASLIGGILLIPGMISLLIIHERRDRSFKEVMIPANGYEIAGYLSPGTSANGPWVVFGHGNRQEGQAHELYERLLDNLQEEVTVLAIDLRGFGKSSSEGLASADNILDRSGDFDAAVLYLKTNFGATDDRIILMGHSLGAAQALRAAQYRAYHLVIPIGLGNYEFVVASQKAIDNYGAKFQRHTGVTVESEVILKESQRFTPAALFSPCPKTPVALVFGAYEHDEALLHQPEKVPEACASSVHWIVIPLSDHMYGTERNGLPGPVRRLYSTVSLNLLTRELNHLLSE